MNGVISAEAEKFLYQLGLKDILMKYVPKENIFVSGSYALATMAWRDLDIYLDIDGITQDIVYKILKDFIDMYRPVWLESKDSHNEESGCPKGFFIGFETYSVSSQLWNVDIIKRIMGIVRDS